MANDALSDADRALIDPDYNGTSGKSVRVIGYSTIADAVLTVVLEHEGIEYGVNGWPANATDRHIYNSSELHATQEGEADEQGD